MLDRRYFSKHPKKLRQKTDAELAKEVKEEFFFSSSNHLGEENLQFKSSWKKTIESFVGEHKDDTLRENSCLLRLYFKAGDGAIVVTRGKFEYYFSAFVFAIILIAAVNEGIKTYPSFENNPAISMIDDIVFSTFALEFAMKVVAEKSKPLQYFVGKDGMWNTFDFFILIFCIPGISHFKGKNASVLRLVVKIFRLFRVTKLLRTIPALSVIMTGLMGSIESIGYIGLLLFMFMYVYAVVGVSLFARSDPFFFRSMPIAFVTLFHALTFDNWSTNFYVTAYGCDMFHGGIYVSPMNMTDAQWESVPKIYRCEEPKSFMSLAVLYWISYITITAFILLSLFIGAITISMHASMTAVRIESVEAKRKKLMAQQLKELEQMRLRHYTMSMVTEKHDASPSFVTKLARFIPGFVTTPFSFCRSSTSLKYEEKIEQINETRRLLNKAFHCGAHLIDGVDSKPGHRLRQILRELAIRMRALIVSNSFQFFVAGFVTLTAVLIGVEMHFAESGFHATVFYSCEWVVFVVLVGEVFIRLAAEEMDLAEYLKHKWNIFDIVIAVLTFPPISVAFFSIFRICRLLRIVRLVEALPQLGVVVNSVIIAGESIGYIFIIILLVIYVFSLVGVMTFGANDPSNFGSLDVAMRNLFEIATLDNWGLGLYANLYGCDVFANSPICDSPYAQPGISVLYFVTFIILTTFIMFTLFIGVITTALEEAIKHFNVQRDLDARVRELSENRHLDIHVVELYRRVFNLLDWDGSGSIEANELQVGLGLIDIRPSEEELLSWIREVDADFDGVFDLAEFVMFMMKMQKRAAKQKFVKAARSVSAQLSKDRRNKSARDRSNQSNKTNQSKKESDEGIRDDGGNRKEEPQEATGREATDGQLVLGTKNLDDNTPENIILAKPESQLQNSSDQNSRGVGLEDSRVAVTSVKAANWAGISRLGHWICSLGAEVYRVAPPRSPQEVVPAAPHSSQPQSGAAGVGTPPSTPSAKKVTWAMSRASPLSIRSSLSKIHVYDGIDAEEAGDNAGDKEGARASEASYDKIHVFGGIIDGDGDGGDGADDKQGASTVSGAGYDKIRVFNGIDEEAGDGADDKDGASRASRARASGSGCDKIRVFDRIDVEAGDGVDDKDGASRASRARASGSGHDKIRVFDRIDVEAGDGADSKQEASGAGCDKIRVFDGIDEEAGDGADDKDGARASGSGYHKICVFNGIIDEEAGDGVDDKDAASGASSASHDRCEYDEPTIEHSHAPSH